MLPVPDVAIPRQVNSSRSVSSIHRASFLQLPSSPPSKQNISVEEQRCVLPRMSQMLMCTRLFPGPSGLVKEFKEEAPAPAQAKVPSTILEKIPKYLKPVRVLTHVKLAPDGSSRKTLSK